MAARERLSATLERRLPTVIDADGLNALAGQLDGFSSADCAALIREAALTAMRESMSAATVTAERKGVSSNSASASRRW